MHTPSKAWVRVRSPSTTFTATRTVSPGAKSGTRAARGQAGDLLGLVTLDDVHRSWSFRRDFLTARPPGWQPAPREWLMCARPKGPGGARA